MNHDVVVCYTIDDDGIWLNCSCGWSFCVGLTPILVDLVAIERAHLVSPEIRGHNACCRCVDPVEHQDWEEQRRKVEAEALEQAKARTGR